MGKYLFNNSQKEAEEIFDFEVDKINKTMNSGKLK